MTMIDVQMQTPPPRLPLPRTEDAKTLDGRAPLPRPSVSEGDDLEPYNLPFTD